MISGPYDLSLVEGSVTTPDDAERIHKIRRRSKRLVTIGACATAGGIQALRNFGRIEDFVGYVYARPEYIDTLARSTPIHDHVWVDFELRGCPIDRFQLIEVINAFLNDRRPNIPHYSQCIECKRSGAVCVMVAQRHALPRPGHPGRLRQPLPAAGARLLRLLRPDGRTQHRQPRPLVPRPRQQPREHSRRLPHLQRRCGALPQGERSP